MIYAPAHKLSGISLEASTPFQIQRKFDKLIIPSIFTKFSRLNLTKIREVTDKFKFNIPKKTLESPKTHGFRQRLTLINSALEKSQVLISSALEKSLTFIGSTLEKTHTLWAQPWEKLSFYGLSLRKELNIINLAWKKSSAL